MFAIPFCVMVGWIIGRPLDLNFQLFETATLFMTVLVVAFMLQDGTSNYFKGLMLVFCYLIVTASFFVHIDPLSIRKLYNFLPTYLAKSTIFDTCCKSLSASYISAHSTFLLKVF